ncbi:hypothetical protein PS009_24075, partial [Shigella sonnei]|nr:hypothetical protein [Shigella sonnei]
QISVPPGLAGVGVARLCFFPRCSGCSSRFVRLCASLLRFSFRVGAFLPPVRFGALWGFLGVSSGLACVLSVA